MRPLLLIALAEWRELLTRPAATASTLLAIALAVALMVGVDLAATGARRAFDASFERLAGGLTHEITARAGLLTDADYLRLRQQFRRGELPGVRALTPRLAGSVRIDGVRFDLIGVDLLAGRDDRALTATLAVDTALLTEPGAVLASVDPGSGIDLPMGGRVSARTPAGDQTLQIVGHLPDRGSAERLLLADVATAKELLATPDALTQVDVVLACDANSAESANVDCEDGVRAALPSRLRLRALADRHAVDAATADAFYFNLTALSLLAAAVAAFLVHQVVVLDVQRRATASGRLAALGVTVRERFVVSALPLAACVVVGAGAGILLGWALAQVLGGLVLQAADDFFYRIAVTDVRLDGASVLRAVALAVGVGVIAAWAPLRDLARRPVVTLLRGERPPRAQRVGWWWPMLAFVGAVALLAVDGIAPAMASVGILLLGAALLVRALPMPRLRGLVGALPLVLAVRDLGRNAREAGLAVGALVVAVAAALAMAWMIASFRGALVEVLDQRLGMAVAVRAQRFAPDVVATIEALGAPSVFAAQEQVAIGNADTGLRVVSDADREAVRLGLEAGALGKGRIAVSEPLARRLGVVAGSALPLPPFGMLQVGGVFREYGNVRGSLVMDAETARRGDVVPVYDELLIDADPERVREVLTAAAVGEFTLYPQQAVRELALTVFERTFRVTTIALWLALLVAAAGLALAVAAWMEERARELAVLRALGFTRGQMAGLLLAQVGLLAGMALLLALPVGAAAAWLLVAEINPRAFGWSYPLRLETQAVTPLLLALAAMLPLAALPALWRLRLRRPARLMAAARGG